MAVTCWIPNCLHNNFSHTCRFFKFPKDPKMRNKWLKFIKGDIQPKPYSTVCSCHFPEGKKEHGPQIALQNIEIKDVFSVQPSTPLLSETSEEIHKIEDISSDQCSQDYEIVLVTEKSELNEIENSNSSFQDFDIVLISETPSELHEIVETNPLTSKRFQRDLVTETSAKILKIENNSSSGSRSFPINAVTKKPTELHEIKNNSNDVKPSTSQHFKRDSVTKTYAAKIQEIKNNSNGISSTSDKTDSEFTKNNLDPNSKPPPSFKSIALFEAENYFLKKELEEAKKLQRAPFNFDQISENDKLVALYTGLPNALAFNAFYKLMENIPIKYRQGWKVVLLSRKDQLFMTLMKVRYNFPRGDLAYRFNVSESVVANIIPTWIHVLHDVLREQLSIHLPSLPSTHRSKACLSTHINCKIIPNCAEVSSTTVTEISSTTVQTLDPLNVRLLVKLWMELHHMVWPDKKKIAELI